MTLTGLDSGVCVHFNGQEAAGGIQVGGMGEGIEGGGIFPWGDVCSRCPLNRIL